MVFAACLLTGSCSSGSSHTTPTAATTTTTARHAVKVAARCAHLPILRTSNSYNGPPKLVGPTFDYVATHSNSPIDDGQGVVVTSNRGTITKRSPSGVVTLNPGETSDYVTLLGVGDFDGDTKSDVMVQAYEGGRTVGAYIVLGTVPAGDYDPAVVGVRVPSPVYKAKAFVFRPVPVGDQNHDGADDVGFGASFYSGRALVTNMSATLPAPFRTLRSPYVGLLQLDPSGPPTIVLPDETARSLRLLDRPDRLLLKIGAADFNDALTGGTRAVGSIVNGHHIVEFANTSRSGTTAWRWDLDAPCGT
jgi:hypothetical protein